MTAEQVSKLKRLASTKNLIAALKPYEPEKIYLFGSWARDEQDDVSDIDISID